MHTILEKIRNSKECIVLPPTGLPKLKVGHAFPDDLYEFYMQCGGIAFFTDKKYSMEIVLPAQFTLSNPEILGDNYELDIPEEDISNDWYIVAQSGVEQKISIDLNSKRFGRCYDSFWDIHASPSESPIVAMSFTELLEKIFESNGKYWYWLADDFVSLGDAYD